MYNDSNLSPNNSLYREKLLLAKNANNRISPNNSFSKIALSNENTYSQLTQFPIIQVFRPSVIQMPLTRVVGLNHGS